MSASDLTPGCESDPTSRRSHTRFEDRVALARTSRLNVVAGGDARQPGADDEDIEVLVMVLEGETVAAAWERGRRRPAASREDEEPVANVQRAIAMSRGMGARREVSDTCDKRPPRVP